VKRTPWLSWRLYFLTIPVDVVVLLLSADHTMKSLKDVTDWALVSLIAHASIAPLVAIALLVTSQINSWKVELFALIVLGASRGVTINVTLGILNLEQRVPSLYKVFNSAISLPVWFIGLAIFVESRRQFQREFEALFLRYVRKKQTIQDQKIVRAGDVQPGEQIAHLQSVANNLANEIKRELDLPSPESNYEHQLHNIQNFMMKELRPASKQLWNDSSLPTPKLPFLALLRISLLEQRLKVVMVALCISPYIFIGLNGSQGLAFAAGATFFATSSSIGIYMLCETVFNRGLISRRIINIAIMGSSFIFQLLAILFLIPKDYFWTTSQLTIFLYQLFLSIISIVTLLGFNFYELLSQQRLAVLKHLTLLVQSQELPNADLSAKRNLDLAQYLHGEFQAGLVATSVLLERAISNDDTDLARQTLGRAVDILTQDHVELSQPKVSSLLSRLEKIASGWRGIAIVNFSTDWIEELDTLDVYDAVVLIDEGVANAVRHAKATTISVSGTLQGHILSIEILSNGAAMTNNPAGIGTNLFNSLADSWSYTRNGEQNFLTFNVRVIS
jgi:signal transduction histidine kinase